MSTHFVVDPARGFEFNTDFSQPPLRVEKSNALQPRAFFVFHALEEDRARRLPGSAQIAGVPLGRPRVRSELAMDHLDLAPVRTKVFFPVAALP